MRRLLVAIVTLAIGLSAVQWAGGAPQADVAQRPDPSPVAMVNGFLRRPEPPLHAYRARRVLRATNSRFHRSGELEVETEFSAEQGLHYRILRESGSDVIRNRVLKPILREEQAHWARREPERAALSEHNYWFAPQNAVADMGRVVVPIRPLRRDSMLVEGVIALSEDGDLQSVSGRLSRNPSWWTNRVEVVREYGRLGGVRVPLAMRSTAYLKLVGRSEFEMTYRYESVNGETTAGGSTDATAPIVTPLPGAATRVASPAASDPTSR